MDEEGSSSNAGWLSLDSRAQALRLIADIYHPGPSSPATGFMSVQDAARLSGLPPPRPAQPASKACVLVLGEPEHARTAFLRWYTGDEACCSSSSHSASSHSHPALHIISSGPRRAAKHGAAALDALGCSQAVTAALGMAERVSLHVSPSQDNAFPCINFIDLPSPALLPHSAHWRHTPTPPKSHPQPQQQQPRFPPGAPALDSCPSKEQPDSAMNPPIALAEACDLCLVFLDLWSPRLPSLLLQFLHHLSPSALSRLRFLLHHSPSHSSLHLRVHSDARALAAKLLSVLTDSVPALRGLSLDDLLIISSGSQNPPQEAPTPFSPFPPLPSASSSSSASLASPSSSSSSSTPASSGQGSPTLDAYTPFPAPTPACISHSLVPPGVLTPALSVLFETLDKLPSSLLHTNMRALMSDLGRLKQHASRELESGRLMVEARQRRAGLASSLSHLAAFLLTLWIALAFPLLVPMVESLSASGNQTLSSFSPSQFLQQCSAAMATSPLCQAAPSSVPLLFLLLPHSAFLLFLVAQVINIAAAKQSPPRIHALLRLLEFVVEAHHFANSIPLLTIP